MYYPVQKFVVSNYILTRCVSWPRRKLQYSLRRYRLGVIQYDINFIHVIAPADILAPTRYERSYAI